MVSSPTMQPVRISRASGRLRLTFTISPSLPMMRFSAFCRTLQLLRKIRSAASTLSVRS